MSRTEWMALDIIKPQARYTLTRDEIQPDRGDDDMYRISRAMICQACGLDKKIHTRMLRTVKDSFE